MKLFYTLFLVSLLLFSCSKPNDPENVLRGYIGYRFQKDQSKAKLLGMTSSVLKQSIETMTDEEFAQFVDISKYQKRDIRILNKKCSVDECFITYTLSYDITQDGDKTYNAEIRKVAKLTREDEIWKVADVNNIKTFYDSKKPIDVKGE